jgi:hypothetical protein
MMRIPRGTKKKGGGERRRPEIAAAGNGYLVFMVM